MVKVGLCCTLGFGPVWIFFLELEESGEAVHPGESRDLGNVRQIYYSMQRGSRNGSLVGLTKRSANWATCKGKLLSEAYWKHLSQSAVDMALVIEVLY